MSKRDAEVVKVWWKDATLWTNIVAVTALILNNKFGIVLTPEIQAAILAVLNVVLKVPRMAPTSKAAARRNAALNG